MKQFLRAAALAARIFFWANAGVSTAAQLDLPGTLGDGLRLYVAQPGDNFLMLGRRVGFAPELLAALNNLSPGYSCRGGEELRLPLGLPYDEGYASENAENRRLASRSGLGERDGSTRSSTGPHHGLDIAVPKGTPILAAHGGTVLEAGWKNDIYGYAVVLEHGNGWQTLYAHCSRVLVQPGQQVRQGERIALVGSTGNSTGPHLHLELHKDGAFLNPADFFSNLLLEV